jgi:hypothetical protein
VQLTSADLAAYEPPRRRANIARGLLVALLLLDLVAVWSSQSEYTLLDKIDAGEQITEAEANRNDNRQAIIAVGQFGLFIVCVIFFLAWFTQAYRNISALGAEHRRYTQGWAIGSWFVPFLNLVRPKQIADDIWRGSDPDVMPERQSDWRGRHVHPLLTWWGSYSSSPASLGTPPHEVRSPRTTRSPLLSTSTASTWRRTRSTRSPQASRSRSS